jgi:hypothetical protein
MNDSRPYKINPAKEPFVKKELEEMGYTFTPTQNAFWRATDGEATLTFFHTGTFLIQSKDLNGTTILLTATGIIPFS